MNSMKKKSMNIKPRIENKTTAFQKFSLFFFRNKRFSLFAWIVLLVFGAATYTTFIQREGFPSIQVPISIVNGNYFVNDKARVDSEVSKPISDAIKDLPGVKKVTASSFDNFANLVVSYKDNIDVAEGSKSVEHKIDSLKLPSQLNLSYENIDARKFANEYDMLVGVFSTSGQKNIKGLNLHTTELSKLMAKLDTVSSAEVIEQSKFSPDGKTEIQNSFDILGFKDSETSDLNFYQTLNIGIKLKAGQDILDASSQVEEAVQSFSDKNKSNNLSARVSADFAPLVRSQVSSLQENMLEAFVIVALVSFALISWRAGLATALTMITVLLTTVSLLYLFGLTLNVISLFALILSLGLIVDDAIIISESIDSHRDDDKSRQEIVKEAVERIGKASAAGTLTTILAFAPMLFISGILGGFISAIPITIITSLALSLILSLSLIPFLASNFLLSNPKRKTKHNPVQIVEKHISGGLAKLIKFSGKNRKKGAFITTGFILLSLAATMVGGSYFAKSGFDILPSEKDSEQISVNISYKPSSTIEDAFKQAERVNLAISKQSKYVEQVSYSGSGSAQNSTISLDLTKLKQRDKTSVRIADELQLELDKLKVDGTIASASSSGMGGPASDFPLTVQIFTQDQIKANGLISSIKKGISEQNFKTNGGTDFKIDKSLPADTQSVKERIDGKEFFSLKLGFDIKPSSEVLDKVSKYIKDNFNAEDSGLQKDAIKIDLGFEEENQESFKSLMVVFPIMLFIMYLLLAFQFKSFLQPLFIFMAIPFSFLGVGAGLYYTNNSASFFVMIGFFALIGIAVNNTILITDFANQERLKGVGRIDSIASALQARFRPLLTTSLTAVVALIPLALSDPFWESLSVTLIFGLLSSTLLVILCFPYYLIAAEVLRSGGRKVSKKLHFKKNRKTA